MGTRFDSKEVQKYKNIFGGIAFPGKRPGFAVIIGQAWHKTLGSHDLVYLDEVESDDTRELIRLCGGLDYFYYPKAWIGDSKNQAAERFIREFNKDHKGERRGFHIRRTPILEMQTAFAYMFPAIKELLYKPRRRLFLKEKTKLVDYLRQPQEADLPEIVWGDYPAVEALAFAVLELERINTGEKMTSVNNNYQRI